MRLAVGILGLLLVIAVLLGVPLLAHRAAVARLHQSGRDRHATGSQTGRVRLRRRNPIDMLRPGTLTSPVIRRRLTSLS